MVLERRAVAENDCKNKYKIIRYNRLRVCVVRSMLTRM